MYQYLVEKINGKKIVDLVNDDVKLITYLLENFGMYI